MRDKSNGIEIIIPVTQELDELGGEFLDCQEFNLVINVGQITDSGHIPCIMGDKKNCYVSKEDLLGVCKSIIAILG